MGLNLSNRQIAQELDISETAAQKRCTPLRETILAKQLPVKLSGEVECDELYNVAGHKGHPKVVEQESRPGRRRRLKGDRGRSTLENLPCSAWSNERWVTADVHVTGCAASHYRAGDHRAYRRG